MSELDEQANPGAVHAEQSVHEIILEMLEDDSAIDATVKNAVLDALAEVVAETESNRQDASTPTYLTGISVVGFRGIGNQTQLELHPAPGLTVVSGRNGSGKSSFAEALELTLTGTSYRWHKKETLWAESWRNLHRPDPCAIRVGFTAEGTGPFTVGVDWAAAAGLTERSSWTQVGAGDRVDGTDDLGWARPLELSRPVLSYDELGRLFDGGPSALYDALAKLLGLEVLADAEKWLAAQLKSTKVARDRADDERKRILTLLAENADERADRAAALLKKRGGAPLDEVLALVTGSDTDGQAVVSTLRTLARVESPTVDRIEQVSTRLRAAVRALAEATGALADGTRERVDLLQAALRFHDHVGDSECPVCGRGQVDGEWAEETRRAITRAEEILVEYRAAATELTQSRSAALELIDRVEALDEADGVKLQALETYSDAVTAARERPAGDDELATHLESTLVAVAAAADTLRTEAAEALAKRENTWAPIAAQLGGWVSNEQEARELDGTVKTMIAAKKWMNDHTGPFRNMRLETIAAQARKIWGQLRQESNVDLGDITLQGTATRRRAVLGGSVDGQPTKALSVMSQGELHALALALFLPRATAAKSPFRFVVLDDPIQAMDPAKIDGFVHVLSEIAQTHQVIVFSHDDRLASMIRETGTDARLVEVVREAGSKVTVRDNIDPALRQVNDVFALLKDDRLPDEIRTRVMPGLFRLAVEAAARQAYYAKQSLAGRSRAEFEKNWTAAKKTATRLALAVLGDPSADLTRWLDAKPERRHTLRVCNAVHHDGMNVSVQEARELERTVKTLLASQ
jgi:recombinational DNA repair ATPase RecF